MITATPMRKVTKNSRCKRRTNCCKAKSYLGFTAQTITQETIAGDGSTIVSVYYKRNIYTVTFWSVKGTSAN